MHKPSFTTEKIVYCTHDSVRKYCSSIMGIMYLGADNSSIDCRGTLAIPLYSQLYDLLRCNLKQTHEMRPIHLNQPTNVILYVYANPGNDLSTWRYGQLCRDIPMPICLHI